MIYFIEIDENKIISKGMRKLPLNETDPENIIEVSQEVYEQIKRMPADIEFGENGEIINIANAPEPPPVIVQERVDPEKLELCKAILALDNEIELLKNKITELEGGAESGN